MTTPADMPGPTRPIDIQAMPAVVNLVPIPGTVEGKPATILRLEIITPAGSAFAHMSAEQLEQTLGAWADLARQARTGITIPPPGLTIPNGQLPR